MKKRKMKRALRRTQEHCRDVLQREVVAEKRLAVVSRERDEALARELRYLGSLQDAWDVQTDLSNAVNVAERARDLAVLRMTDADQRFQTLSRIHEELSQKIVNAHEPVDPERGALVERMSAAAEHLARARREAHATGHLLRDIHVPGGEKLFDGLLRLATHLEDAGHALGASS